VSTRDGRNHGFDQARLADDGRSGGRGEGIRVRPEKVSVRNASDVLAHTVVAMDLENLAERIRGACLDALLQAYEDAGVQGLCAEGRWEAAVGALRTLDLAPLLREFRHSS